MAPDDTFPDDDRETGEVEIGLYGGSHTRSPKAVRLWNSAGRWRLLGLFAGVLILVNGVVLAWLVVNETTQWDPLGPYPVQEVTSNESVSLPHVGSVAGSSEIIYPVFNLGDDVTVSGTKCVSEGVPVDVVGTVTWRMVDPPGTFLKVGEGVAVRQPGCETFNYANPIPAEVQARSLDMAARGHQFTVWQIVGVETPVKDGSKGVPQPWQSANFAIRAPDSGA